MDPVGKAAEGAAKQLVQELYSDTRSWLVQLASETRARFRRSTARRYGYPQDLLRALVANEHDDGDVITLDCRPALVGSFLRRHFLSPVIGNRSDMRLGPSIAYTDPSLGQNMSFVVSMIGHITTHLMPVGLYPPLPGGIQQACLYPTDVPACGFTGAMPIPILQPPPVPHVPALLSPRHLGACNRAARLTGTIRRITSDVIVEGGVSVEEAEFLRQAGAVWILDLTDDDSTSHPNLDVPISELWGGLYASGHLDFEGELPINVVVGAMDAALKSVGVVPLVTENKGAWRHVALYAKGIRSVVDLGAPVYSIHMDAELAEGFSSYRRRFDAVTTHFLSGVAAGAKRSGIELRNPHDLDFSYTNSAEAYTVMASAQAAAIRNPLAIAIRDWHRKRMKGGELRK